MGGIARTFLKVLAATPVLVQLGEAGASAGRAIVAALKGRKA